MTDRHASCSCGQLAVRTRGESLRVSICHCLACQKRTGSVFGAGKVSGRHRAPKARVEEYVRVGDEGRHEPAPLCLQSGSTVFRRMGAMPGVVAVAVGAFADTIFRARAVYEARQHHRGHLAEGIELP